jgi:hypothetical protein
MKAQQEKRVDLLTKVKSFVNRPDLSI